MWRKARFRWDNQNCKKTHISPLVTSSRLRSKPNVNAHTPKILHCCPWLVPLQATSTNLQQSFCASVASAAYMTNLNEPAPVAMYVRYLHNLHMWTSMNLHQLCLRPLPPQASRANMHGLSTFSQHAQVIHTTYPTCLGSGVWRVKTRW